MGYLICGIEDVLGHAYVRYVMWMLEKAMDRAIRMLADRDDLNSVLGSSIAGVSGPDVAIAPNAECGDWLYGQWPCGPALVNLWWKPDGCIEMKAWS